MITKLLLKPKNFFFLIAFTLTSILSFGQQNKDIINKYLSENIGKFNLTSSDVLEWKVTNEVYSKQSGVTHVYIQQLYNGIPVFNGVSNISIKEGKVVFGAASFIKNIADKVNTTTPVLSAKKAIEQTSNQLKLGNPSNIELLEEKNTHKFIFSNSGISQEKIPVELVYQTLKDSSLKLAWKLNVNQLDGIHWWNVRVDAVSGKILEKNDWGVNCNFDLKTGVHNHKKSNSTTSNNTAIPQKSAKEILESKTYNVFALPVESPSHGDRSSLSAPENATASPFGWHDTDGVAGAEHTITRGNNVYVQLDDDGSNGTSGYSPDGGASLNFNFPVDFEDKTPDTYRDASLTNLFYMSNVMHDIWYQYGFDEAAGNFQTNNYNNGGDEGDHVIADGQDASGRNNANFATPADGQNPRMQMFIWDSGKLITINSGSLAGKHSAIDANFTDNGEPDGNPTGAPLEDNPVTGNLVLMNDGSANPSEGCALGLSPGLAGNIAVIRRGNCNFTDKIQLAQGLGAIGVIMVNNEPGLISMGGSTTTINIPAVSVTQELGEAIITAMETETINTTLINYGIDGSFDNGIVAHEYGHGISNRLIGGGANVNCMSNAEQLGEGWSDYFGIAITMKSTDTETTLRGVGTFAQEQEITGNGIRRFPYTTDMSVNTFTLDDVKDQALADGGVSVHGVGSIWATMLWDLQWKMIDEYGFDADMYNGNGGNNKTMELVIEGLKLTPCGSGFVGARDAIIAADETLNGGANKCLIWQVFARRGLGYSASSGSDNSFTDQVEAFDMPPTSEVSCALSVDKNPFLDTVNVYPNPASSSITISLKNYLNNSVISIFDISGKKVYHKNIDLQKPYTINTQNLSGGIYVLKINNQEYSYSKKLIIK